MATAAGPTLALLAHAIRLKQLPRTGWLLAGVTLPESVADHSFGTALVACLLGELVNARNSSNNHAPTIDVGRAARIALLHDLSESLVTDLPRSAADIFGRDVKRAAESVAMREILDGVPGADAFSELWADYKEGKSPEAQLVRDADKLELVAQAREYASTGIRNLDEFWQGHSWRFAESQVLFEALLADVEDES